MIRKVLVLLVGLSAQRAVFAQCPDGSPPPCRPPPPVRSVPVDTNAIAVLPFHVSGPREAQYLREGMMDLLNIALDGVGGWRVVRPSSLARAAAQVAVLDVAAARRIARENGAGRVILGSAVVAGPQLQVRAELYDAVRGPRLWAAEARGRLADPAPLVDSVALDLARNRLLATSGATKRLVNEYVTTSPRALRAYLAAEQLARRGAWQAAADSLLRAISSDSTFGLAYYRLYVAQTFGANTPGWGPALSILEAAVRHVERLPQRQQDLLRAAHALQLGLAAEALRGADELARRYPDDAEAAVAEGEIYFHLGLEAAEPFERALIPFARAVELDPGILEPYNHLIELLCIVGDTTRAWQQLAHALRIDSTSAVLRALELAMRTGLRGEDPVTIERDLAKAAKGDELFLERASFEALRILALDPARAFAVADSITAIAIAPHRSRTERLSGLQDRVGYRLSQGRYREAWDLLEQVAALEPASTNLPFMRALYPLITELHVVEGRSAARWLATTPNKGHFAQLLLGLGALQDGDSALLAAAFRGLDSVGPGRANPTEVAARVTGLHGLAALRRGDSATARTQLALAYQTRSYRRVLLTNTVDVRFALELARVERAAGALEAAARRTYYAFFGYWGSPYRADAEELLAQIAEQRGDTTTAVRAYRNVVQLWQNADPELQPRVGVARAALARLERE